MLERSQVPEAAVVAAIRGEYGIDVAHLDFLALGADQDAASYRAVDTAGGARFLKVRRGGFAEIALALPGHLAEIGIREVIAPLHTRGGRLRASVGAFEIALQPFVSGRNGNEIALSDAQWAQLARLLRKLHEVALPPHLDALVPRASVSTRWSDALRAQLARPRFPIDRDPVIDVLGRTDRLADAVRTRPRALVLCHADVHAGNVLLADDDTIFLVDWDQPILAPRERDLMFIGGGYFGGRLPPEAERAAFERGYGPATVDPIEITYHRYARIVEDIALFCDEIEEAGKSAEDRALCVHYLNAIFAPRGAYELARAGDPECSDR
jgi:spectinomycin phosphotransferase